MPGEKTEPRTGPPALSACARIRSYPESDCAGILEQWPEPFAGYVDLATIQRYVNHWYTSSLDLFGGEISSNAADYFATGLKGRDREERYDDHVALVGSYAMQVMEDGRLTTKHVAMRNAMNEILRDEYIRDNERGVARWNKIIHEAGVNAEIKLPDRKFNRKMGIYSGWHFDPSGRPITEAEFTAGCAEWLPTPADRTHVSNLMLPVLEQGRMAHWIAAPLRGINGKPLEFEYLRRI